MKPTAAYRRAVLALRAKVHKAAPVANLYRPEHGAARSPEVVRAWTERQRDLSAIIFFQELLRDAKVQSKARRESKTY